MTKKREYCQRSFMSKIALMIKKVLKTRLWNKFHDVQIFHFQAYIHKKSHLQKNDIKGPKDIRCSFSTGTKYLISFKISYLSINC